MQTLVHPPGLQVTDQTRIAVVEEQAASYDCQLGDVHSAKLLAILTSEDSAFCGDQQHVMLSNVDDSLANAPATDGLVPNRLSRSGVKSP